ncbi:MAG: hypothetical protein LUH22_02905 [Bacteroides sp.]|nr:hypothetical protein [Bacteroides sp.]
MIHRDYIMRLLQLFFEALAKFIRNKEGKDPEILRPELEDLYKTYLKVPWDYYKDLTMEQIINSFDEDERLVKMEIVAELFYQDALLEDIDIVLLKKARDILKYVDLNSDTFSFDRQRKVSEIEDILQNY